MNEAKNSVTNSTEMVAIPLVKLDNLIAAVEQMKAGKMRPFMYAIEGPDGEAHIDENCVAGDPAALSIEVNGLNDSPDAGYRIVPVYLGVGMAQPVQQPAPVAADLEAFNTYFSNYFCNMLSCDGVESGQQVEDYRVAAYDAWREATRRAQSRAVAAPVAAPVAGQEPVAEVSGSSRSDAGWHATVRWLKFEKFPRVGTKLYAAPVPADECMACDGHGARHHEDGEWHDKCPVCKGTGIAVGQPDSGRDAALDDLSALVRQLVHALGKAAPRHSLPARAMDYLQRKGLQGSPLRAAHPANVAQVGELSDAQITQALKIT